MHARQRDGLAVVDVDDACVSVGAPEQLGVEHPAKLDVVGEGGVALGQLHRVDLDLRLADDVHLRHVDRGDQAWHRRWALGWRIVGVVGNGMGAVGQRAEHDRPERLG